MWYGETPCRMSRAGLTKLPLKSSAHAPVPWWKPTISGAPTIKTGNTPSTSQVSIRPNVRFSPSTWIARRGIAALTPA